MWSISDAVWVEEITREPGQSTWVSRVKKHTGMTPANQRTRKSTLRRRAIEKQAVMSRQYLAAQRNLNLLLTGVYHAKSN